MNFSTREIVLAGVFAALACCVAIVFRFVQPVLVPFSLLPMVFLLAGGVLPPRAAAASMLGYALLGLAGLPVLAAPPFGGVIYIFKPTFGFILGYAAGAWTVSMVIRRLGRSFPIYLAACTAGIIVLYLIGLPYLYIIIRFYLGQTVDIMRVLQIGFLPFIGLDLAKAFLSSVILVKIPVNRFLSGHSGSHSRTL